MKNALAFDINNKSIIKFAGMSIILMIFVSLYTMVDGIFISNYVGSLGLSAINIIFPVVSFLMAICIMFGTGGSAICGIKIGEHKYKDAKRAFTDIFIFCLAFMSILIIPIVYYMKPLIYALGADDTIIDYAEDYLFVYMLFAPALTIQFLCQFFLFTAGKPEKAFMLTFIGGLANIIFDYVFIALLDMKLTGAALATGIGETLAAIYGIYCFMTIRGISLRFTKPTYNFKTIAQASINGSSELVNSVAAAVMIYLFNKNMMELAGTNGVAAITIVLYVEFLLASAYIGYSNGVAPVFSFNLGEKNYYKLRKLFKRSLRFIGLFSLLSIVISYALADVLAATFVTRGTEVFDLATFGLRLFAISFAFLGFNIFASALFTAFSNGKVSAMISFLRTMVFIVGLLIILPKIWGITGVWLAVPIAEFLMFVIVIFIFKKYKKVYKY